MGQVLPHAPQLRRSELRSAHATAMVVASVQRAKGDEHVVAHAPPEHT